MDNFIMRWYNQNRRAIWIVILIIAGIILLIQTLNNDSKTNTNVEFDANIYNEKNYSGITQEKVNPTTVNEVVGIIEEFFNYCNNGQVENAYYLISAQCKKELYPTIEDFKTNYYNRIFTEYKVYDSILWVAEPTKYTYKIEIMPDLLATGKEDSMPIEDYYTVMDEFGKYKLNISRFIGEEQVIRSKTQKDITVNILSKKTYMDYEIYEINVTNKTGSKLTFNTKESTNSIYIQDTNELKYIAFLNEIPNNKLEIQNGFTEKLEIKFNRGYGVESEVEKIVFSNIKNNRELETIEVEI